MEEPDARSSAAAEKVVRHALIDRLFHWTMATSVLVLLGTAFLPILGVEFGWVTIHWVTGVVLTLAVIFHIVRAVFWRDLRSIRIGTEDLKNGIELIRWSMGLGDSLPSLPGKYSLAQKSIHHAFTLVVLITIVTGCLMLVKVDTPWWERDPYWLAEGTWGVTYVLHDFAALLLISMIMAHVYFALRPEKLHFTRSMIVGWITRREYRENHDTNRWRVDPE